VTRTPVIQINPPRQEVSTAARSPKSDESPKKVLSKKKHRSLDSKKMKSSSSSKSSSKDKHKSKSSHDSSSSTSSSKSSKSKRVIPEVEEIEEEYYSFSDAEEKTFAETVGTPAKVRQPIEKSAEPLKEEIKSEKIERVSFCIEGETEESSRKQIHKASSSTTLKIPRSSESLPVPSPPSISSSEEQKKAGSHAVQKSSSLALLTTPTTPGQQRSLSTNDASSIARVKHEGSDGEGTEDEGTVKLPKGLSDALSAFFTPSGRKRSCTLKKEKEGEDEKDKEKEPSPKEKVPSITPSSSLKKPASVKSRKTTSAPATITEDSVESSVISATLSQAGTTVTVSKLGHAKSSEKSKDKDISGIESSVKGAVDVKKLAKKAAKSEISQKAIPSSKREDESVSVTEVSPVKKRTQSRSRSPDKKAEAVMLEAEDNSIHTKAVIPLQSPVPAASVTMHKRKGRPPTKNPNPGQKQITEYFSMGTSPVRVPSEPRLPVTVESASKRLSEPAKKRGRPPKRKLDDLTAIESEGESVTEPSTKKGPESLKKKLRASDLPGMDKIVARFSGEVVRRTTPPLEIASSSSQIVVSTPQLKEGRRGRPRKKKSIKAAQLVENTLVPVAVSPSVKRKGLGKSPVGLKSGTSPKRAVAVVAPPSPDNRLTVTPKRSRSKGKVEDGRSPSSSRKKDAGKSPSPVRKTKESVKQLEMKTPSKPATSKASKVPLASPSSSTAGSNSELIFLDPYEVKKSKGTGSSTSSGSVSPAGGVRLDCGKVAALVKERAKVELMAQSRRKSVSPVKHSDKEKSSIISPLKDTASSKVSKLLSLKQNEMLRPSSSSQVGKSSSPVKKAKKQHLLKQLVTDLLIPSATPGDPAAEVTPSGRPKRAVTSKLLQSQTKGENTPSGGNKGEESQTKGASRKKMKEEQGETPIAGARGGMKARALSLASVSPQKDKKKFGDKDAMRKYLKKKALIQNAKTAASASAPIAANPLAAVFGRKDKKVVQKVLQPKVKNGGGSKIPEPEEEEEEEIRPTDERAIKAGLLPGTVLPDDITDQDIEMFKKAQSRANEVTKPMRFVNDSS
jgi:hypothetical protein